MKYLYLSENIVNNLTEIPPRVRSRGGAFQKLKSFYFTSDDGGKFPIKVKCKYTPLEDVLYRTYLQMKKKAYFISVGGTQCQSRDLLEVRLYPAEGDHSDREVDFLDISFWCENEKPKKFEEDGYQALLQGESQIAHVWVTGD